MSDISKRTEKDLVKELSEKRTGLLNFRLGVSGSKVRNVREGRATRKDIARLETELNRRRTASRA